MVLVSGKNSKKVNEAMSKEHVISAVTKAEVQQMKVIYETSEKEKNGIEYGYKRGENGSTSKTVTGIKGEVPPEAWVEASKDLNSKGTTALSDNHLHPLHYDKDGNVTHVGNPKPSHYPNEPGRGDTDPANTVGNTEPSMVMGYRKQEVDTSSGAGSSIGGTKQYNYVPTIGFYIRG